jgi:hypothetical protein
MSLLTLAWLLTVSPHVWDKRDIVVQRFDTQAECLHAAVAKGAADRLHGVILDWRCRNLEEEAAQRKAGRALAAIEKANNTCRQQGALYANVYFDRKGRYTYVCVMP